MALDFERIKQRKIVQWAVAYLAAAVGVVQVLDVLANQFEWPHAVTRASTIVLAIGFFAALVLAWYHGEKGMQRATGVEVLLLASLVLVAGASVAMFARSSHSGKVANVDSSIAEASIAVLPFRNFSSDKEQEYFSDGITEEILNALAQIGGLQVAARTSSFAFKDKDIPVDEIGTRLHVAHILEGSVRKAGDQLRITAQLINAQTGFHLWSQTFDRDAKDIFAVQDEIAQRVAAALKVTLAKGDSAKAPAKQVSDEAHNEYLLGLFYWNKRTGPDLVQALMHFQQATQLQPDYAAAWAGVANTWSVLPVWTDTIPGTVAFPKAKVAAERALALDPDLPEGHAAMAVNATGADYDWAAAEKSFKRALELNPNYATAWQWYGESFFGRDPQRAVELLGKAAQLDPLSKVMRLNLGHAYVAAGDVAKSIATTEQTIALDSTWFPGYRALTYLYLILRDTTAALSVVDRGMRNAHGAFPDSNMVRAVVDARFRPAAIASVNRYPPLVSRTIMLTLLHDRDGALNAFEEAIRYRHTDEQRIVTFPGAKWLRSDPRFIVDVKTMNIRPPD